MTILSTLSRIVALLEIAFAALLTVATTGLILLNIVTRTSGNALYWSDFLVLVFFVILMWLCLLWFDPLTLYRVNFSLSDFSGETFNFIYQETTTTLGIPKFWLWSVMPAFAVFGTLHALAKLLERDFSREPAPEPEAKHAETLR